MSREAMADVTDKKQVTDSNDELLRDLRKRLSRDRVTRIGIAVLVVALGGFGAWASLVPLTEGVVATGSVVVDTAHKTIQHLEGGIVEKLYVREGSEVMAGDVLIKLSETQTRAELELLESRYYGRRAEIDRLNAERVMGEEIVFSEELLARRDEPQIADVLAMQRDLFEVRRRQYQGQIEILRHRIEQLEEKIRGLKASRNAGVREQALIEKDLKSLRALYDRKLIDESSLIARQREFEQSRGEIGRITAEVAAARVAVGEARQEIIQLEHNLRTEVSDRLTKAQQEWFETRKRLVAVRDILRRTRIVAPQGGKVIGLTAHTVGGVVPPASPILNIVPSEEKLMVEGRVRPTDVDNVYPGLDARLRFSAFKQRTTPEVLGHVERVSPDAFLNEETRETYYVVRIRVSEEELAKLGAVKIGPGMPVDIMIKGGERTAMQYLADPLMEIIEKALVEE